MTWTHTPFTSVRDLATAFLDKGLARIEKGKPGFVWRGEPEEYVGGILARIDRPRSDGRPFLSAPADPERVRQECEWYLDWWDRMAPLILPRDRRNPNGQDDVPSLDWLNFAAHHGCRTRLVDWSYSPWVALYFACSRAFDRPGRVWCFDAEAFENAMESRWDALGVPRLPSGERDVATAAFRPGTMRWIVTQYNSHAPIRMSSQQGLFTMASQLGQAHDILLDEIVPDGSKFVFSVPQESGKIGLLGFLRTMGTHHESLQYPMLDQVAGEIDRAG